MPVKNICNCNNPPGGTVVCEPDQLAICIVNNGIAQRECIDSPDDLRDLSSLTPGERVRYLNWALSNITGEIRRLSSSISNEDLAILSQGHYHNDATGDIVTFSLPDALNLNSPSSPSSSSSGSAKRSGRKKFRSGGRNRPRSGGGAAA